MSQTNNEVITRQADLALSIHYYSPDSLEPHSLTMLRHDVMNLLGGHKTPMPACRIHGLHRETQDYGHKPRLQLVFGATRLTELQNPLGDVHDESARLDAARRTDTALSASDVNDQARACSTASRASTLARSASGRFLQA